MIYGISEYFKVLRNILDFVIVIISIITLKIWLLETILHLMYAGHFQKAGEHKFVNYYAEMHSMITIHLLLTVISASIGIRFVLIFEQISLFVSFIQTFYIIFYPVLIILLTTILIVFILIKCSIVLQNPPYVYLSLFLCNYFNYRQMKYATIFRRKNIALHVFCLIFVFVLVFCKIYIVHYFAIKTYNKYSHLRIHSFRFKRRSLKSVSRSKKVSTVSRYVTTQHPITIPTGIPSTTNNVRPIDEQTPKVKYHILRIF